MTTYRQVLGLYLNPDVESVVRSGKPPPYVNHDAIDFAALETFLTEEFFCDERVRVRVPDDTIDIWTMSERDLSSDTQLIRCLDFGELLLAATPGSRSPIPVRKHWAPLQLEKDRRHTPPPSVLAFVTEGRFEAVGLWLHHAQMRLGVRAADPGYQAAASGRIPPEHHRGYLDARLSAHLQGIFGLPFLRECLLSVLARSPAPAWANLGPLSARSTAGSAMSG